MKHFQSSPSVPSSASSTIVGIWRLGECLSSHDQGKLFAAQPADAAGSTRWDYVFRRGECDAASRQRIASTMAAGTCAGHPNLISVLDGSIDSSVPYVVTPRIKGRTLAAHAAAGGVNELPVLLWIIRQTADALDAMHQSGWVHGFVAPQHVMLGRDGHVTLIDLGWASSQHTVRRGALRNSSQYSAPETANANHAALAASDVFSLGRMLWESLADLSAAPQSSTLHSTSTPSALEPVAELVEEMVSIDPSARPLASVVSRRLLQIELGSLATHFRPGNVRRAA